MKGFAEVVEIPETKKDEKYIFGTIKNNGDSSYVTFDGSDFLTPITSAMGYEDGDRVMVMVKSHRAIVVNNMTSPAVTGKYVKENYASFENLSATNAQIGYLRANMITTDVLEAKIGEFGYLKADVAELKFASIETLNATNAEITNLKATTITTDNLTAEVAKLGYASVKDLEATTAKIDDLSSKTITADNLRTEIAKIGYLTADEADIRYLTVSTANATFLHADMSDMDIAKIQTLFATAGIVSDMTIKDGHITGVLDSVTVNANSITTGTLSVDRLVIRGSGKSLVYELNNITGALQAKSVDTLNGEILTQRTITADKLVAKSITSNEIKAGTITSDEIEAGTIKAANINVTDLVGNSAFINSLKSNTVIVGLQNDINGISVGGRNLLKKSNEIYLNLSDNDMLGNSVREPHSVSVVADGKWNAYTWVHDLLSVSLDSFRPGDVYTLSVDVKTTNLKNLNTTADIGIELWKDSDHRNSIYGKIKPNMNGIWQRVSGSCTLTYGEVTSALMVVRGYDGTDNGLVVEYRNFKLEKGNRATDWTPAPEDVDSLISAAQSTADSASSLAGTANSAAGAAQSTANTALTTANNAKKNVYASYSSGGINNQYCHLADITVSFQYGDGPIKITMQSRNEGASEICIDIDSGDVNNPAFYSDDSRNYINSAYAQAWVAQDNDNKKIFHLYVSGGNWYNNIVVTDYINSSSHALTWVCKTAESIPSNAQQLHRTIGMGRWCYNNDITYINGGKIYTGTVTADQLAANSVTAGKIKVDSLSAISANIGTVTAGTIQSNNYVKDVSGMKLSLTDGSWDSKYTKINGEGKIECSNIAITGGRIDVEATTYETGIVKIKYQNRYNELSSTGAKIYNEFTASNGQLVKITAYHELEDVRFNYYSQNGKVNAGIYLGYGVSDSGDGEPYLGLVRTHNGTTKSTNVYAEYIVTPKLNANEISLNGVSLASSLAGLADDKVLKSNRGWYPNGKSLYAVSPGVYSTNPGAMPGNLAGLNPYGTLLILRENNYQTAIYMSVVGQMAIWAANSNAWSIIKS